MKDISLPFGVNFNFTGSVEIDFNKFIKVRDRGKAIVQSSLDIEEFLKEIIAKILFRESRHSSFLTGLILDSSSCTFLTKKKMLISCLKHFDIFTEKINIIDEHLAKVIKYRNAFAHGKITPCQPFYLEYFEGSKQKKELTEKYWSKLELYFNETDKLLKEINLILDSEKTT